MCTTIFQKLLFIGLKMTGIIFYAVTVIASNSLIPYATNKWFEMLSLEIIEFSYSHFYILMTAYLLIFIERIIICIFISCYFFLPWFP